MDADRQLATRHRSVAATRRDRVRVKLRRARVLFFGRREVMFDDD
jgi:hypothetical protein